MATENGNYQEMKEIFSSIGGCDLHEKHGGRFVFTFYLPADKEDAEIDCLELSVRSTNGLKRRGYATVGQLARGIWNGDNIKHIRGCGAKSYAEIMEKLFLWNIGNMPHDRKEEYIVETIRKNAAQGGTRNE